MSELIKESGFIKLGKRTTAWRTEDIHNLLQQIGQPEAQAKLKGNNINKYHSSKKE